MVPDRVTSPATFVSHSRKAGLPIRDKVIQAVESGVEVERAALQYSIPVAEAELIWKSHIATLGMQTVPGRISPAVSPVTSTEGS
jgi:hypothetical protein